mgnify:CR=1 FL=1
MSNKQITYPSLEERVCFNCKYMIWLVALGLGVRCGYKDPSKDSKTIKSLPLLPGLRHTCDNFEFKKKENEEQS